MRCIFGQLTRLLARVLLMIYVVNTYVEGKVFERCELAKTLHQKHGLGLDEVAKWVCIAQHTSSLNTEAYASGLQGGSHGLFQISDVFWCSPPGKGFGCNVQCSRLRDADLTDDLACARIIHAEHQRLSGDGYNAWQAYQHFCRFNTQSYVNGCFLQATSNVASTVPKFLQIAAAFKAQQNAAPTPFFQHAAPTSNVASTVPKFLQISAAFKSQQNAAPTTFFQHAAPSATAVAVPRKRAKIYKRCELAQELYYKHKLPMEQIPTWVCIAQHESSFDTSAVGRLNIDGSLDHGLFQISDLFWCSNQQHGGNKACGLHCNKLLDDDISDDVRCIRQIHSEHVGISGDGFAAWTVYKPYCRNQRYEQVSSCFKEQPPHYAKDKTSAPQFSFNQIQRVPVNSFHDSFIGSSSQATNQYSHLNNFIHQTAKPPQKGKVYKRCELAQELYFKHKFPMQDIATWVCIAEHESNYDTAAVGRLNGDGSADHGLFQISDLYWCAQDERGGKACDLPCDKLLDDDLMDDVQCIRTIHEEHTRLSGDGYTAWTVYDPYCRSQQVEQIAECFDSKEIEKSQHGASSQESTDVGASYKPGKRKVYQKCELAQELYFKQKLPMKDIPTWVCIAQYESSYDTSAVGRLNADGSADHGLFQISDLYWCSHERYGGKACNIPCSKLIDNDITDDVRCIKTIHDEHTRISGDGFNAWTVYNPHCRNQQLSEIATCFDTKELEKGLQMVTSNSNSISAPNYKPAKRRVYKKCELAQELYYKHKLPIEDIPTWVCIAEHESSYDTSAVGRLNTDGSADHGLFQISDLFWCTHDSFGGKACNIPCSKLLDDDLTDDINCIKTIHEEHTRISGDGFTAWTVYNPHCRNQQLSQIAACFDDKEIKKAQNEITTHTNTSVVPNYEPGKRKVYKKCELAQELYYKHKLPIEEIPTWVCIAQHESSFDTSALGRLNTDGSIDHGLFQISDIYWCTHDTNGGKACNLPCSKLLDDELTDDIRCIRTIHEEHTRLSGDGFNAWTVYKPHCRNQQLSHIATCFDDKEITKAQKAAPALINTASSFKPGKRKVYEKCELAQELYFKHKLLMKDIPTWVCIAQFQSSFDTSAVGRHNSDGSANHGLFQISDLYWCSDDAHADKACNIPCHKLVDTDLTDDIRCIKIIHEEHIRLSGDGFNAWTVYKPHCQNQQLDHISACFDSKVLAKAQTENTAPKPNVLTSNHIAATQNGSPYASNPFLNSGVRIMTSQQTGTAAIIGNPFFQQNSNKGSNNIIKVNANAYANNPFLNGLFRDMPNTASITKTQLVAAVGNYASNPFLNPQAVVPPNIQNSAATKPSAQALKQQYQHNPFLNGLITASATKDFQATATTGNYKNNPFLQQYYIKPVPTTTQVKSTVGTTKPLTSSQPTKRPIQLLQPPKHYVKTETFRATPSLAANTTAINEPITINKATASTVKAYAASSVKTTTSKPQTTPYRTTTRKPTITSKTSTTKLITTTLRPSVSKASAAHNKPTVRASTLSSYRSTAQMKTPTTSKPSTARITPTTARASTTAKHPTKIVSTAVRTTVPAEKFTTKMGTVKSLQTTTTKKPITTLHPTTNRLTTPKTIVTNRKPIITNKESTRIIRTTSPRTKSTNTKAITTTTKKPLTTTFKSTTTTRKPTTSTRKSSPATKEISTTTRKPTTTTRKPTTTTTTRSPTTTRQPTTTTTRKPTTTTTRTPTTTTTRKPTTTMTRKPTTTTTRTPTTTTTIRKPTTTTTRGPRTTTTRKPTTTTTRKSTTITRKLTTTTTRRPTTSAQSTKTTSTTKSHKTTSITSTHKSTIAPTFGRSKSQANFKTTTVKIPTVKSSTLTTRSSERAQKISSTTRKPTAALNRLDFKDFTTATTRRTTTTRKTGTTSSSFKFTTTTARKPTKTSNNSTTTTTTKTTNRPKSATTNKYPYADKNKFKVGYNITKPADPFSHPFFDKFRDRFSFFTTTTPKPKHPSTTTDAYYDLFHKTNKSIYAYSFGQNLPLMQHNLKLTDYPRLSANKSLT